MKNQIAWLKAPQKIEIEDAPMPEIGPDEVLVQSCHVGICGSDAAFFMDPTLHGRFQPKMPFILGHEVGGIVVEKGALVRNVSVGDKVAVEPGESCGKCEFCLSGRYNLCPNVNFMATTPFERGALCRYFAYPARLVFRLEENMTTLDGAMMEPFAVGMHAAKRGQVSFEHTVVLLGAGCIGLMTMLACRVCGVRNIIVADVLDSRLANALEKGATHVINSAKRDLVDAVMELTDGKGADVVFETAGNKVTTAVTCELVKRGGRIVVVAQPHEPVAYDMFGLSRKEAEIIGVFRYVNLYPAMRTVIHNGLANVSSVVSHKFPFEEVQRAFEMTCFEKQTVLKAAIEF